MTILLACSSSPLAFDRQTVQQEDNNNKNIIAITQSMRAVPCRMSRSALKSLANRESPKWIREHADLIEDGNLWFTFLLETIPSEFGVVAILTRDISARCVLFDQTI